MAIVVDTLHRPRAAGRIARPLNASVRGQPLAALSPRKFALVAFIGAVVYQALLWVSYTHVFEVQPPSQWWVNRFPSQGAATLSWFVLINSANNLLAAGPMAIAILFIGAVHRVRLGLAIGCIVGVYGFGSTVVQFGVPETPAFWVIEIADLLSMCLSICLLVVLSRPLTTRSSGP